MSDGDQPRDGVEADRDEVRVSSIELFFDLVFVFTITQLTTVLARRTRTARASARSS